MLISQAIPSLIGGVSQMPPALRHPACCEVADNCYPSPIDGLTKRPPTQHTGFVSNPIFPAGPPATEPLLHWINRDGLERYVMAFNGAGQVQVLNLNTGANYPVIFDTSYLPFSSSNTHASYLTCSSLSARKSLRTLSIGDTTYVANTEWATKLTNTTYTGGAPVFMCVIWVKAGNYSQTYTINLNGALAATYTTGATGNVGTDNIASQLGTNFATHGFTLGNGWNVVQWGSYVVITASVDFKVDAFDSAGGNAMSVVKDSVSQFSQLPQQAYNGQIIKVTGDLSSTASAASYYVRYFSKGQSVVGPGTWQECPQVGSLIQPDLSTMPRAIQRLQDTDGSKTGTVGAVYFNITCGPWAGRTSGDTTSCPDPSFFGHSINDIFLYSNRLGFLTDTTVCLSQSGNFANFYRTTALQLLDSDAIDVSSSHPRVVRLRHATPWQQQLVIFGDLCQFIFGSTDGGGVTPSNVQIMAATEYDADPICAPVPIQNMLYFPYNLNGYVGIREYYVEYYTQKKVGKAITDQVAKYIPGNCKKIIACNAAELMAIQCDGDPSSLYIYKWQWNGNTLYAADKGQSAWCRWNFDQPNTTTIIHGAHFYGQVLYLVISRVGPYIPNGGTQVTIESLSIDSSPLDSPSNAGTVIAPYVCHLDQRVADNSPGVSLSYNPTTNTTAYSLPLYLNPASLAVVTRYGGGSTIGPAALTPATYSNPTGTSPTITIAGNTVGQRFWFGELYTMRYRFSPFLMREQGTQGQSPPNLQGRLQIRTLTIRTQNTGYYRVEIGSYHKPVNTQTFTGTVLGDNMTPLGAVPGMQENQQMRFLIGTRNDTLSIDLVNDTPLPCRFTSAEWEGLYYARARRA